MRRRLTTILLVLFLIGCGGGVMMLFGTSLDVSFTYTYSQGSSIDSSNNYPACSATVTTNCITGFNVYDNTSGSPVLIGNLSNPSTPTGTQTMLKTFTLSGSAAQPGTHNADATTVYVGSNGGAAESAPSAPAAYVVPAIAPSAPAALTFKVH